MNCMLHRATNAEAERVSIQNSMSLEEEESFATTPMVAVKAYQSLDEEELHTSFEAAISDRITAVRGQLSRISGPLPHRELLRRDTDSLQTWQIQAISRTPRSARQQNLPGIFGKLWQQSRRGILLTSLVIMSTTLGFDIMGLLVLHMH